MRPDWFGLVWCLWIDWCKTRVSSFLSICVNQTVVLPLFQRSRRTLFKALASKFWKWKSSLSCNFSISNYEFNKMMLEENGLIIGRTVPLIRQTELCSCYWKQVRITSIITVTPWKPVWSQLSPPQAPPRAPLSWWQLTWSPMANWQVRRALWVQWSVLWKIRPLPSKAFDY